MHIRGVSVCFSLGTLGKQHWYLNANKPTDKKKEKREKQNKKTTKQKEIEMDVIAWPMQLWQRNSTQCQYQTNHQVVNNISRPQHDWNYTQSQSTTSVLRLHAQPDECDVLGIISLSLHVSVCVCHQGYQLVRGIGLGHCWAYIISLDYTEAPVMATPTLLNEGVKGPVSGNVMAFVLPDVHSLILPWKLNWHIGCRMSSCKLKRQYFGLLANF